MYSLLNKKLNVIYIVFIIFIFGSCQTKQEVEKFKQPVDEIIQLNKTKIGLSTIASDLKVPWDLEWGKDGTIWFTVQEGFIKRINPHTGRITTLLDIRNKVYTRTTPGLLGMAVYAQEGNEFVFIIYTHQTEEAKITLRLERYKVGADTLIDPFVLKEIPGGNSHNGSRVVVSREGKVYWATGDLAIHDNAQNLSSPNGKVLRLNMDGSIPKDNPYPGNPVWALGFRAPQGLVFAPSGALFLSTHGPATDDEVNLIHKGGNYGWPEILGYVDLPEEKKFNDSISTIEPLKAWTPTIAPAGIAYYHSDKIPEWKNAILLVTLKGSSLRVLKLNDEQDSILSEKIFFENKFGRLRDVCVSSSGDVYIATSNRDWKQAGKGQSNDDRIIRIGKVNKEIDNLTNVDIENPLPEKEVVSKPIAVRKDGKSLYQSYCSSCHRVDGEGVGNTFPALNENKLVTKKERLIAIILNGDKAIPQEDRNNSGQEMPSFNFLDNEQIANISTYIRTAWDNKEKKVNAKEVKKIREKIN